MADYRPPSNIPPDDEVSSYVSPGIDQGPDTPDPEPKAFVDDNSIIYLNNDIHEEMAYAPLSHGVRLTQTQPKTDYVLLQAFTGNKRINSVNLSTTEDSIIVRSDTIDIDLLNIIRDRMGLSNGQYDIRVCIYRNYVYSVEPESGELNKPAEPGTIQIEEISPSRQEIRVKATLPKFNTSIDEWEKESRFSGDFSYDVIWPAILKDVERNISLLSTNWQSIEFDDEAGLNHIIFRLTDPLPSNVRVGNKFQITRDLVSPYSVPVTVDLENNISREFDKLRGPNFKAVDPKDKPSKSTLFETWNSLVGTEPTSKQRIIDKYLSGSLGAELNFDFRKYENFIHFSSAEERLKNFKYKLELVEYYASQSKGVSNQWTGKTYSGATSSVEFLNNKALYESKKAAVISSFDDYEHFLYYESHSTEYNTYGAFPAATWPKSNSSKPYNLVHTTGSEAVTWYNNQLISASIYDDTNNNILRNTIPLHILSDENSTNYITFIDMVGQHFDTIFNYISNIEKINDHEESVYEGVSKDLIYDVAKSFGWNLQSGFDTIKLWEYALGVDSTGSYDNATDQVRIESYSHQDIEKQTWKRIVNNIPYLLKTKGTARGIKALLNTYGIPSTILRIQEFGGPAPERITDSRREIEKFTYALNFTSSAHIRTFHGPLQTNKIGTNFTSTTPTLRPPSMYEFRIDTAHTESGKMHLVSTEESSTGAATSGSPSLFEVILEPYPNVHPSSSLSKYGRLNFILTSGSSIQDSASTDYAPFFDNDWWNISFGATEHINFSDRDSVQTTFEVRYAKIGEHADRITHSGSANFTIPSDAESKGFYNSLWAFAATDLLWGGTGSGNRVISSDNPKYAPFSGSMQEIRGWAEYISDTAFHQHTLAPTSIIGNSVQMAYNDLILRLPLGTDVQKYNHSTVTSLSSTGSIPNKSNDAIFINSSKRTSASFVDWNDSVDYSPKSETYYVNVPNTVGLRPHDNKIRIEDNKIIGNTLSWDRTYETSSFDSNALDNEQVSIALSPQDQIDIDIAMQFGGFSLDDYIGDPRDRFTNEYSGLRDTRNLYFKKFDKNNSRYFDKTKRT